MSEKIVFKNLTPSERLQALEAARQRMNAIASAIDAIVCGAVSATVSTAGGSRSYTRASLAELRQLYAAAVRQYKNLRKSLSGQSAIRRLWARWS